MAVIKARTRGKHLVKVRTRLDVENTETLHAYARFLGESVDYVLNQVVDTVLARDKDFQQWRVTHPEPCRPATVRRRRPARGAGPRLATLPDAASAAVQA